MAQNSKKVSLQVLLDFDKSLFSRFSVETWNMFVENIMSRDLLPAWSSSERPQPVAVIFDFQGLRRTHYNLDGVNLAVCWLENADFTGASLKGASLGCGRNVIYRNCRLDHADFEGVEISGCDFSNASGLESALFTGAIFDPANPPIGLPEDILAKCLPDAPPPPVNPREPRNPKEPSGFTVMPLRCAATIHVMPHPL